MLTNVYFFGKKTVKYRLIVASDGWELRP